MEKKCVIEFKVIEQKDGLDVFSISFEKEINKYPALTEIFALFMQAMNKMEKGE